MATINDSYMDRADALKMARGEAVSLRPDADLGEIFGPAGEVIGHAVNGGMRNPRRVVIPAGAMLLRFGVAPSVGNVASGGWWLDWENYQRVETYADRRGRSIAAAVRELCAVPAEWSEMTMMVQARTRQPLSAFKGEGNTAFAVNVFGVQSNVNPGSFAAEKVEQLFIPGLTNPDLRKDSLIVRGYRMMPTGDSRVGYSPEFSLA